MKRAGGVVMVRVPLKFINQEIGGWGGHFMGGDDSGMKVRYHEVLCVMAAR